MLVLFLPYCLFGDYWGELVAVEKNIQLEMRWERAWGKRNEWSLRNGNEYFPKLCSAEVGEMNGSGMKCRESK